MTRLAIIADDLTGAADAAVAFANQGHSSRVLLDPSYTGGVDIVSLTTESRHVPPTVAAERVYAIAHNLYGTPLLYKKIDSTLRGNIAAELFALMDAFELNRSVVAPAFPAQGRTTIRGRQLINGKRLEETDFRKQIISSNVREIFLRAPDARPVGLITLNEVRRGKTYLSDLLINRPTGILIADAETDEDLTLIARAVHVTGMRLLCGSAGLCHAVARQMPASHDRSNVTPRTKTGPILAVAGSLHAATIAQIEAARQADVVIVEPESISIAPSDPLFDYMAGLLADNKDVVLASHLVDASTTRELTVSDRLARFTNRLLKRVSIGGLVLTGGEVASAVCVELGVRAIDVYGEVQPGIPYGALRSGGEDNLRVVTKAGGFGEPDALLTAMEFLKEAE